MAGMAHRDDPRLRYEKELERLEKVTGEGDPGETPGSGRLRGDVSEPDAEAIRDLLDTLDPAASEGVSGEWERAGRETE